MVTLPMRATHGAGVALLTTHAAWVAERLAALPQRTPLLPGTTVKLDDIDRLICHVPTGRGGAWLAGDELERIEVAGAAEFVPRRVRDFLRAEARRRLSALVAAKCAVAGLSPTRLTVKDTSSRWGSCAADGSLAFCWRLVMAPPFVQDYVAAHEVAHLRHMNHGPRFWALTRSLTPHMDSAVAWLKREGTGLLRVG